MLSNNPVLAPLLWTIIIVWWVGFVIGALVACVVWLWRIGKR